MINDQRGEGNIMKKTRNLLGITKTRRYAVEKPRPLNYFEYFPNGIRIIFTGEGQEMGIQAIPNTKGNKIPLAYWKFISHLTGRHKKTWIKRPTAKQLDQVDQGFLKTFRSKTTKSRQPEE